MYNFDLKKIGQRKIILLGEMHGVKENVEIMKTFVASLETMGACVTIALEWPTEINASIKTFLNNTEVTPPWQRWGFVQYRDGRISREHIAFLRWLKIRNNFLPPEKKHDIFCFSEKHKSWNKRDLKMARNINSVLSNNSSKVILAVMGSLHAQKEKFVFDGEVHAPLATHLSAENVIAFKCNYRCGAFFNHTLQFFESCNECDNENIFIEPASTEEFDYYIVVPCAHAVALLDDKKKVIN